MIRRNNKYTRIKVCGAGLAMLVLAACGAGSVDSGDLKTEGIHATFRITSTAETTSIDARLTAGGPNGSDVKLTDGDSFTARAFGKTITLERKPVGFGALDSYVGIFGENIGGEALRLSLMRADNPDAANSFVILPEKIIITDASIEKPIHIDDRYLLVWDNNAIGSVEVSRYIKCASKAAGELEQSALKKITVPDTGERSITFSGLLSESQTQKVDTSKACSGFVSLTRTATGTLDENLDGGNIKAYQSAAKRFKISVN